MNKSVQFETSKPEFVKVLRKRVNTYFKENNKNRVGIRMFPHMYPVVPSTVPISSVYSKYASTYHKDGTIKDYVHSPVNPAILVTSKTTVDTDADSDGSKASFVMSPFSPMGYMGGLGVRLN